MEFVRNLRARRGYTQGELAVKCGCHATTISQIESSRMLPSLELYARIARVLRISPSRLLNELLTAYQVDAAVTKLPERASAKHPPQIDN